MTGEPVTYVIDGARIRTLDDVFTLAGEAVRGEGGCFGRNLDAFADCLTGGYGTPEDGRFYFVWENSSKSREALGYTETARQLGRRLEQCHPTNRDRVRADLERALRKDGPTAFDWVVDIFEFRDVRLDLR
ncbi:barstar family protein [Rhodococcus koreensis]|uniref:barstar family protein n=1 Tax=Rhodococcus koreensis TaxID=99653 RepID=UPI0036D87881